VSLLQGPVVFIDDQIADQTKSAYQLKEHIRATGRPIAEYRDLPPIEQARHWRSIAFLVLDWDLVPGSPGALGASTLSDFQRQELFTWLESFIDQIFCPIFVISAEDVDDIRRQIDESNTLQRVMSTGRLAVFSKDSLMEDFLGHLENWVSSSPALAALNIWANEYERATDRLFQDMEQLESDWPAYVWKTATEDGVDPSYELATVISANLLHRIDVVQFDVPAITEFSSNSSQAMRRVTQGRTVLPKERLYETMVLPGDLFEGEDDNEVWVNITPACHTVLNRHTNAVGAPDPDGVALHLVRGVRLAMPTSSSSFKALKNRHDGPNGMLIHALFGDAPYAFSFRTQRLTTWGEIAHKRIGRLLPPYITLLQQRNAAYLMNEGVPRVSFELYGGAAPT